MFSQSLLIVWSLVLGILHSGIASIYIANLGNLVVIQFEKKFTRKSSYPMTCMLAIKHDFRSFQVVT